MNRQKQAAHAATISTEGRTQQPLDPVIAATARRQSVLQSSAAFLGVDPAHIYNVLRGIWSVTKGEPPLTDSEIWRGLALIARYELDPFAREIYVTRNKGRLMIILGIDGWVRVLDRTEHYDGFEQDIERDEAGTVLSVTTRIYSKAREHPAMYQALASEYAVLGGFMAKQIPIHMLRLFSFRHAARLFVPIGACVTEEEARWIGARQNEPEPPVSSLDDLADRLEGTAQPAESEHPELADQYATLIGEVEHATGLESLWERILIDVAGGRLTAAEKAALTELATAAKARLSKV